VFDLECIILGYQCCEACILLHWTKNDVWECFGSLRLPSACKKMHNLSSSLSALFWGTKVGKHPFYSVGPKMLFGSVSEHFANIWHVQVA
jgi:hypothetical protein